MLTLLLCAALAQEPASPPPSPEPAPPVEPLPPAVEAAPAPLSAADLLDEALLRREQGDLDGAEQRLEALRARGEGGAAVPYQLGLLAELRERREAALGWYQATLAEFPGTPEADDARFRTALVLDDLGRCDEAQDVIDGLRDSRDWAGTDALALELESGISRLCAGKARKGVAQIQTALDALEGTQDLKWHRARARDALLDAQLAEAASLSLASPRKSAKNLGARRDLINQADAQRAAITALGEPEYVLSALLAIGDAALALHRDTLASPPPRKVAKDAELVAWWRGEVAKEAEKFRTVAYHYYEAGADVAARVRWQGQTGELLRERRDALAAELGLPVAQPESPPEEPGP